MLNRFDFSVRNFILRSPSDNLNTNMDRNNVETEKVASKWKVSEDPNVVHGRRHCQSADVKWLSIHDVYEKMHRPSIYDLGGTYADDLLEYWFTFKTEKVGNIFLLHLFTNNNYEGIYTIGLSNRNDLHVHKKKNVVSLSESIKYFTIKIKDRKLQVYLTTYSFTDLDLEFLKDKKLYIAVSIVCHPTGLYSCAEEIDNIKAQHDCRVLLNDPVGSDFTIESEDGVQFNVHKVLLTTHSDVFKAMLKEETAESQNNRVTLIDVAADDVRAMIQFIYTGTILENDNVNFTNLLMVADRYNLKGMRDLCNHALAQQITVDNALDILILADMYDSDCLKNTALKFIKKHRDALSNIVFTELNNVQLLKELCAYLAS